MTLELRTPHDVAGADVVGPAVTATAPSAVQVGLLRSLRDAHARRRCDARLAELAGLQELLGEARAVLDLGWIQRAWFAYLDGRGDVRRVSSAGAAEVAGKPLVGVCLIGALVTAGGGPHAVHARAVQRSLDLAWHALTVTEGTPVAWSPGPDVRLARVRDLTAWNDDPARSAADVTTLLLTAERVAVAEGERLRAP